MKGGKKGESLNCLCVCVKVVINGVSSGSGDHDTENTELMAIYTKDNQRAEKVTHEEKWRSETKTSCHPEC